MGNIRVLDEHIANQIAAGEVVERPASVVKELVENSIDAGSTRIDVFVEEGGMQSIRVVDNGSGMDAEDCQTAFFRHATSKIANNRDLFRIRTLGFRGEALPSIAAIARVECISSDNSSGLGHRIVMEGGSVQSFAQTAAPKGTDIVVRDLFFNTPARLKYMKTLQTELGHITDVLYRMCLAHPHIAFSLRHNGNLLLQTLGNGDLLQVIAAVYGTAAAKNMIEVLGENADYRMSGWISKPELTRSNRQSLSMFVNGRYIRNYALAQAVLSAYHTLLPVHRYPIVVLHLNMDPQLVDVNVHPSKLEVRFSKESELFQFVEQQLKDKLRKLSLIPAVERKTPNTRPVIQEKMELYPVSRESQKSADPSAEIHSFSPNPFPGSPRNGGFGGGKESGPSRSAYRFPIPERSPSTDPSPAAVEGMLKSLVSESSSGSFSSSSPGLPKLHPIGQLHGTYIVAQNEEGLYLIDQHAAHERIHYEMFYEKFGHPDKASQELIVPVTLDFTPAETVILKARLDLFAQVGVHLEHFGGNSFIARSCPHWFPKGEEKRIIEEMAEWILQEKQPVDLGKLREKSAILCACKTSIKANESLSLQEMEALLDRLRACSNPFTCPHGRPIVVSFSVYELKKMFKRVM